MILNIYIYIYIYIYAYIYKHILQPPYKGGFRYHIIRITFYSVSFMVLKIGFKKYYIIRIWFSQSVLCLYHKKKILPKLCIFMLEMSEIHFPKWKLSFALTKIFVYTTLTAFGPSMTRRIVELWKNY